MKIRTSTLLELKRSGKKFSCLTSYDQQTAEIFDSVGIEVLLVGDSASNTVLANDDTISVTLDEMIPFGKAVARSAKSALVVFDLPFGSYEESDDQALKNSIRVMKETGAHAVKLEGPKSEQIRHLVDSGIPVMGHAGFTPQSVHALGGYKIQGKNDEAAKRLREDCLAIEEAGAFAVVLEMVPADLAAELTSELTIPTIGIGAGAGTDGQVLVWTDFAGLSGRSPSFSKSYLNLRELLTEAATRYRTEVAEGAFPTEDQSF
ncbi:3-methyl-2-oxobutanoate hydroxymethyltransferase [bacterium]|nr:3-methyl-2-oxobutanoate hydroxymethyltransferase [bacterium]